MWRSSYSLARSLAINTRYLYARLIVSGPIGISLILLFNFLRAEPPRANRVTSDLCSAPPVCMYMYMYCARVPGEGSRKVYNCSVIFVDKTYGGSVISVSLSLPVGRAFFYGLMFFSCGWFYVELFFARGGCLWLRGGCKFWLKR